MPSIAENLVRGSLEAQIEEYHRKRDTMFKLFWDYYFNRHYFTVRNEYGEPLYGFGKKRVKKNFCKFVVEESISALFGEPPTIKSAIENEGQKIEVEKALKTIWATRSGMRYLRRIGLMGGVTGDAYVQLVYNPEKRTARPVILDTSYVTPITDPDDIDIVKAYIIDYVTKSKGRATRHTKVYTEEGTTKYVNMVAQGTLENPYDFVPIVHIKNIDIPNSIDGLSDIQPIYELNNEINYATSDRANAVHYHGNPLLALKDCGARAPRVGPDRMLMLPGEKADAFYVKRDMQMEAVNDHIADLKKSLLMVARLPEELPEDCGNLSGVAIALLKAPLMKLAKDKQTFYGEGLEKLNEFAIRMLQAEGALPVGIGEYETTFEFAPYLPVDEKAEVETKTLRVEYYGTMVDRGFMSQETAMTLMQKEGLLDVGDIKKELKKIEETKDEERDKIFATEFRKPKKQGGDGKTKPGDNPTGKGPTNQGDKGGMNNG